LYSGFSQAINIGTGINFGGPIPTKKVDGASGKPLPGLMAGVGFSIPINEVLSFAPALYYSNHSLEYGQNYTKDTMVTVVLDNISGEVPSFYTVYVNGAMNLHYIDINLLIKYKTKRFHLLFGPYFSMLIAGKDAGKVRVVIGKGGFVDDYFEDFDNFKGIRKLEQGIMLGSQISIYKNLAVELKASRSFFSLYTPGKLPNNQGDNKMYNTYMTVGFIYGFELKN